MTTEEKLKHFQDICMTDARERSARMLDDYMNALEAAFEEHAADARRRADMQVEAETEKLEREINKRLSIGQLDLKREASHRQEELKDKLFVELRDKLANFMETQDYQRLLDRQVKAAKEFAGDEELIIYMDQPYRTNIYYNCSFFIPFARSPDIRFKSFSTIKN